MEHPGINRLNHTETKVLVEVDAALLRTGAENCGAVEVFAVNDGPCASLARSSRERSRESARIAVCAYASIFAFAPSTLSMR